MHFEVHEPAPAFQATIHDVQRITLPPGEQRRLKRRGLRPGIGQWRLRLRRIARAQELRGRRAQRSPDQRAIGPRHVRFKKLGQPVERLPDVGGRNRARGEFAAEPAEILHHGFQQPEFQHRPEEFKVIGQVFAAGLASTRPERRIGRPMRPIKALGKRIDPTGLQAAEALQTLGAQIILCGSHLPH